MSTPQHQAARRIEALLDLHQDERAVAEGARAVAAHPGDEVLHCLFATALSRVGRLEEALTEAHRALEIDPQDAHAMYQAGLLTEDDELGVGYLTHAVETAPGEPEYLMALAERRLPLAKRRNAAAEDAFRLAERAVELAPGSAAMHSRLAWLQHSFGQTAAVRSSTEHLDRALEIDPHHERALELKAHKAFGQATVTDASEALQTALAANPTSRHLRSGMHSLIGGIALWPLALPVATLSIMFLTGLWTLFGRLHDDGTPTSFNRLLPGIFVLVYLVLGAAFSWGRWRALGDRRRALWAAHRAENPYFWHLCALALLLTVVAVVAAYVLNSTAVGELVLVSPLILLVFWTFLPTAISPVSLGRHLRRRRRG